MWSWLSLESQNGWNGLFFLPKEIAKQSFQQFQITFGEGRRRVFGLSFFVRIGTRWKKRCMISLYSLTKTPDPKWRWMCSRIHSASKLPTFGGRSNWAYPRPSSLVPPPWWSLPCPTLSLVLSYCLQYLVCIAYEFQQIVNSLGEKIMSLPMVTSTVQNL